ncbi:MAG: hypothetical protein RMK00_09470, partial [Bacteroidota bacterium]|nr:hypothetical protein [Bacteroidota bacterium]
MISYQGLLTDSQGQILPNGTYQIQINLYDHPTAGTLLYSEQHTATVSDGVVNIHIGSVVPLPNSLSFNQTYYVGISINGGIELLPRTMLTAVPYALRAETALIADSAYAIIGTAGHWLLNGNSGTTTWNGTAGHYLGTSDNQPLVIATTNTTYPQPITFWTKNFERMRISDTGNVGIGTISPSHRLHIWSVVDPLRLEGLQFDNSLEDILAVNSDGIVYRRQVNSLTNNAWLLTGNSGTNAWNGATGSYLGTSDAQPLVIATTNTSSPQPIVFRAGNQVVLQLNPPSSSGFSIQRDASGNSRGSFAVDLQRKRSLPSQVASGSYSVIVGGEDNTASSEYGIVVGGFRNTASGNSSFVGGGSDNNAGGNKSTISGGQGNSASGLLGCALCGQSNTASGNFSIASGGYNNTASGYASTVSGGGLNIASSHSSTVGGGNSNTASGQYSTVSGGQRNIASGYISAIIGGWDNNAIGQFSAILGGYSNTANANYVLVFGQNVDPSVNEAYRLYLFGDGTTPPDGNTRASGFLVINRLDGDHPIHVGTNNTNGNGAYLSAGGTWTNASTRTKKDRFVPLNPQELLSKIRQLTVEGWYYKGTREYHIGPYAEDFHDAFGTGVLDGPDARTSLAASDVAGVALLGIKALAEQVERTSAYHERLVSLEQENAQLRQR